MKRTHKIIVFLSLVSCFLCFGISKAQPQYIKYGYTYDRLQKGDTIVVNMLDRHPKGGWLIPNQNLNDFTHYLDFLSNRYKYKMLIYLFENDNSSCQEGSEYLKKDLETFLSSYFRYSPPEQHIEALGDSKQRIACDINKPYCKESNARIEIVLMDKEE